MTGMNEKDRPLTRSQLKHRAILDAAVDEFRESGFVCTSMDRIAERAGVSKRTVYNHFESKNALFSAILDLLSARKVEATQDLPYNPEAPLRDQLEALAERELELMADSRFIGLARTLVAETIRSPELVKEAWPDVKARHGGVFGWIKAAVEDGRLRVDDPELAVHQLHALVKAFAFWPQVIMHEPPLEPEERERVIESAVSMFLARYRSR